MHFDPLQTRLSRRLGIAHPVFGFAHDAAAVAAICNAGGFGVLGATRHTPEEIEQELAWIRSQVGSRPFGVNLVLPTGMPENNDRSAIEAQLPEAHRAFVRSIQEKYGVQPASKAGMRSRFVRSEESAQAQLEAVMRSDVNLLACGIGSPLEVIERAKAAGKLVLALVGSPKHAQGALTKPIDILVAQGYDAGAHTGTIGTFSLVPQIVDIAGDVPVLAAGGVATGRHLLAALAMGAQGVWMGTAWLTTEEHHMHPVIRDKLLAARSDDTVISRADSGKTLRQIRTAWSDEWSAPGAPAPLKMPLQDILVGDLLGAIDEHEVKPLMHHPAGQSIAYFNEVRSVADVMNSIVDEARASLGRIADENGAPAGVKATA
ncbi:NAD(P)H-dependent flavin oxidoreductase [Ottowia sp. VDI28]|uniref:NAD(P)H-dependent flavin oxidoreductase n=1 Tax=Ottowia sp. VDI28 TaxID=3133968 RepID=UPI003C305320